MDQKAKINYIYSTVYQILSIILPLVTTPYISRVLSVDSIGMYSFTGSIVSYFVLLASFSFQTYGQREVAYKKNDKERLSSLFFEIQIKKLIFTLLAYVSFAFFFIETSRYRTMYLIQSISIVSAFFDITYLFQGMEQFRLTVVRNTIVKLVGLLLILIFVKKQTDVYLYAIIQTVTVLLGNLSLWLYLPEFISFKYFKKTNILHGLAELFQLFIPVLSIQLYYTIDKTMLGMTSNGMAENGYYEQAIKIIRLCQNMMGAMGAVLLSSIPRMIVTSGKEAVKSTINYAIKLNLFIAAPITVGLIGIADVMVPWFLGSGYERSATLICIFAPMTLLSAISMIIGNGILLPLRRQNCLTIATLGAMIFNVAFNIILIPQFGACGAAVASVGSEIVTLIIQGFFAKEYIDLNLMIKSVIKYLGVAAIMYIVISLIKILIQGRVGMFTVTLLLIISGMTVYFSILLFAKDDILRTLVSSSASS